MKSNGIRRLSAIRMTILADAQAKADGLIAEAKAQTTGNGKPA